VEKLKKALDIRIIKRATEKVELEGLRIELRKGGRPKRKDFDNESDYKKAYKKWQVKNNLLATI